MLNYIEEINTKNNIIEEYFRLYNSYSLKYGKNTTILLLQVGSFFEAYQTLEEGFNLQKLSELLNIIVSKKNKSIIEISNKNPYMLGFPIITLSKFLKILMDNGLTVVLGEQVTPPPNPKRAITNVYSPGTYLDDTHSDANNILSIYIEEIEDLSNKRLNLIIGLSNLDLTTGKSMIYEIYSIKDDDKICLDETVRFIYSNHAKEIIITTNNLNKIKLGEIISYLEITEKIYQHQTITQLINNKKKSIFKISYQQELLRKIYPTTNLLTPIEYLNLENLMYGRLAFIILLNYAYDHSHNIINNLHKPELYNENKFLNLGNNAICQLNLITFDKTNISGLYNQKTNIKSLFDLLNKTSTAMGNRFLKENLTQPLVDINKIESRYKLIKELMNNNMWNIIEQKLIGINDIERITRKINLNIINPTEFYNWIQSLSNSIELFNTMLENNLSIYNYNNKDIILKLNEMLTNISKNFKIDELQKYLLNDINGTIFNIGIYEDIDLLTNKIIKCEKFMSAINYGLSKILDEYFKTKTDLIKIEYNERDGHFLVLTKRRAEVLENILKENKSITFTYENLIYNIDMKDLEFKYLLKGNNTKIFIKDIIENSTKILEYQDQLKNIQKEYFIKFLNDLIINYNKIIKDIIEYIAIIDFLKSGAKIATINHYTIPIIKNNYNNKSYLIVKELRHPIIELLIDKEYIPVDIELGTDKQDGILLFGLNSAGKSSLQKAIGINIIMAQMGYPVAAKELIYYPYHSLMTRISSNDNIFKGLSSFALEMSELRAIIKRSNQNTLVIADEVCKGTEHKSSLIIVLTMIELLSKVRTSFITATHLHDIINFDRLNKLDNIKLYHLHVEYDEEKNLIKYDRNLKEGSGNNFYGLNVAKYLIADDKFMNLANNIKKDIFELPDLLNCKSSNYNSDVYMDKCNICYKQPKKSEIPLETHHIIFQKDFINGINSNKLHMKKNNKSNLVVLCSKCHDSIDSNKIIINGWIDSNKNILDWNIN